MTEKATATKIESVSVAEDDEIDVFSLHLRGTTGKANKLESTRKDGVADW